MECPTIVVVGALGLFVLIFLSLIASFEFFWLLLILGTAKCFDEVIYSLTGFFERSFVQEISVESFEVVDLFYETFSLLLNKTLLLFNKFETILL